MAGGGALLILRTCDPNSRARIAAADVGPARDSRQRVHLGRVAPLMTPEHLDESVMLGAGFGRGRGRPARPSAISLVRPRMSASHDRLVVVALLFLYLYDAVVGLPPVRLDMGSAEAWLQARSVYFLGVDTPNSSP